MNNVELRKGREAQPYDGGAQTVTAAHGILRDELRFQKTDQIETKVVRGNAGNRCDVPQRHWMTLDRQHSEDTRGRFNSLNAFCYFHSITLSDCPAENKNQNYIVYVQYSC